MGGKINEAGGHKVIVDNGVRWELAACVGRQDVFFPPIGWQGTLDAREAVAICAFCPIRQDCLDYAIENCLDHGIWGGKTTRQRRTIRKEKNSA